MVRMSSVRTCPAVGPGKDVWGSIAQVLGESIRGTDQDHGGEDDKGDVPDEEERKDEPEDQPIRPFGAHQEDETLLHGRTYSARICWAIALSAN